MVLCCGRPRRNSGQDRQDNSKEKKEAIERDEHGRTVAHEAAQTGQIRLLRELKAKDVDLNVADNDGVTPVHIAAECNRWDVIEILHSLGVDLSAKDVCSQTPAHYGAWHGHKDVIRVLNKFKVPLDVLDEDKRTPAHYAARQGHCGVLRALFQINSAFFNAKDVQGNLPLHYASGNAAAMFRVVRPDDRENREPGAIAGPSSSYSPRAIVSFADASSAREAPRPLLRSQSAMRPVRNSNRSDDDIYGPFLTPRTMRTNAAHGDEHVYRGNQSYGYMSPQRVSPPRFDSRSHNNVYYEDMNRHQIKSLPSVKESERFEELPRIVSNNSMPNIKSYRSVRSPRNVRASSSPRGTQYRARGNGEDASVRAPVPKRLDSSGGEGRYGGRISEGDDIVDRVRTAPTPQRPKSSPKQRPPMEKRQERQDGDRQERQDEDRAVKKLSGLGSTRAA